MQANRKGLAINLEKCGNLPEQLFTDESRLQQVLLNLLLNAVKYTPSGNVIIKIAKGREDSRMLMFQVSDTGIGMSHEKKVQLFRLFGGNEGESQRSKRTYNKEKK